MAFDELLRVDDLNGENIKEILANCLDYVCSFYNEEFEEIIRANGKDPLIYLFHSTVEFKRGVESKLRYIASEFANEIKDFKCEIINKEECKKWISRYFCNTYFNNQKELKEDKKVFDEKWFKDEKDILVFQSELEKLYKKFFDDSHSRLYYDDVKVTGVNKEKFELVELKLKEKYLSKYFNFENSEKTEKIWSKLKLSNFFIKNEGMEVEVLNELGYEGETYEEVLKELKKVGIKYNKSYREKMLNEFDEEIKEIYFRYFTNYYQIMEDLDKKGIKIDAEIKDNLYLGSLIQGVTITGEDRFTHKTRRFIIFPMEYDSYSLEFLSTIIHEFVHYIGGATPDGEKKGVHYYCDENTSALEEAIANFISYSVTKEYYNKHGKDLKLTSEIEDYFNTLHSKCMIKLFNEYRKEIAQIQFSPDLKYEDAIDIIDINYLGNKISTIRFLKKDIVKDLRYIFDPLEEKQKEKRR